MKLVGILAAAFVAVSAAAAQASDYEIEVKFYLQPDDTGQNTLNKSVEIDGDELTIEESRAEGNNRYIERTATADEIKFLEAFVRERINKFELAPTERLDAPKVEVAVEFDGNTRVIEIEEEYAVGQVPKHYLLLQERFFNDTFK